MACARSLRTTSGCCYWALGIKCKHLATLYLARTGSFAFISSTILPAMTGWYIGFNGRLGPIACGRQLQGCSPTGPNPGMRRGRRTLRSYQGEAACLAKAQFGSHATPSTWAVMRHARYLIVETIAWRDPQPALRWRTGIAPRRFATRPRGTAGPSLAAI